MSKGSNAKLWKIVGPAPIPMTLEDGTVDPHAGSLCKYCLEFITSTGQDAGEVCS